MTEDIIFRRFRAIGDAESISADGRVSLITSTDEPIQMGNWREVLKHDSGCVDISAARSLLINHDPNQLAGGISGLVSDGRQMTCNAQIDSDAKMMSGVNVRKAVANRTLNGVSISYVYSRDDAVFDAESRTVTVNKWRLLEATLTPIPADGRAYVRSLPFGFDVQPIISTTTTSTTTSTFNHPPAPAANKDSEKRMPASENKPQENTPAPIHDETVRAREVADLRERAERAEREVSIRSMATSHGIDIADMDFGKIKSEADGLRMLMERKAEKERTPAPSRSPISIHVDQADKAGDAFTGALAFNAGIRSGDMGEAQKNNPLVGQGLQHSIRQYAKLMGLDPSDWSKRDIAYFAIGKPHMMDQRYARSANVTSSAFPNFVFLNALTKIVATGYQMGADSSRYKLVASEQTVPDFKQFSIGALAGGNLTQTAEDTAFPELTKAEGVYNSTVKMWGATIALTVQAIVNDDTSSFDRLMGQAGGIADKTIDRRVFQKLLMGTSTSEATSTWTSNTTSGGTLVYTTADTAAAARGKLSVVRAAMMNKVGLDGNPLGVIPRWLICGPTREVEARGITGDNGPLLTAGVVQSPVSLNVIATPWLEASALIGNSTTSYYLMADKSVTGLVLTKIRGYESIQVQPYDAGAVAAMNFKLWLPFEADLHWVTVGSSTKTIAAAQQGTT